MNPAMHAFPGSCLAVLLVGSTLLAQRREPLVGTVHDATVKPVGNAEVTLVEDDAELDGLDAVDVCRATTDVRGHFKVSALVGVRYSALACGPEEKGADLVARIVNGMSCGQLAALRLAVPGQRRIITVPLTVDAAGRFERWLQRGRWVLLAMDHTGWATHEFDGEVPKPIELRFTEKPHRRVRVLDGAGRPVAGASFEPGEFRYGFPVGAGLDALLQDLGRNTLGEHLRRVRTDERGEATLHFLPWPNVRPTAFAFVGDHRRRSDDGRIEAGDDVLVFKLR